MVSVKTTASHELAHAWDLRDGRDSRFEEPLAYEEEANRVHLHGSIPFGRQAPLGCLGRGLLSPRCKRYLIREFTELSRTLAMYGDQLNGPDDMRRNIDIRGNHLITEQRILITMNSLARSLAIRRYLASLLNITLS